MPLQPPPEPRQQRPPRFFAGDDVRSTDPRWGLMRKETLAWAVCVCILPGKAISASYDRYDNGACVPVEELGPKTLG